MRFLRLSGPDNGWQTSAFQENAGGHGYPPEITVTVARLLRLPSAGGAPASSADASRSFQLPFPSARSSATDRSANGFWRAQPRPGRGSELPVTRWPSPSPDQNFRWSPVASSAGALALPAA